VQNVERRGQAETDPIKKARIAQFLKEYWGVKKGTNQYDRVRQNGGSKTFYDVAETIGENRRSTERLIKLNDLIPEIQALVSAGKLGTTAAEQLAYLSEDEQRALFGDRGQGLSEISVADAKALRQEIENLRRSLSPGQRAAIILEFRELVEKVRAEARERQRLSAEGTNAKLWRSSRAETVSPDLDESSYQASTKEILAEKAGVGKSSMANLMAVQRDAPDLFQRVKDGEITINKAYTESKKRKQAAEASKVIPLPKRPSKRKAALDAIKHFAKKCVANAKHGGKNATSGRKPCGSLAKSMT
jgi:hypothetical protein